MFVATHINSEGHHIESVYVKTNGYRESISFGAFREGKRKSAKPYNLTQSYFFNRNDNSWWHVKWQSEYEMDQGHLKRTMIKYHMEDEHNFYPTPTQNFDSVYDFYDYIGYNRKTKKYMKKD